ncbi:MAG: ATP-binding protein [Thiolinea sp.]
MAFGKTGIDWRSTKAAVWRSNRHFLKPINRVDMIDADTLIGIDDQKALLYKNTENFLRGKSCCHALLWGARGVGKSSLMKTLLTRYHSYGLRMIQTPREDLHVLPDIIDDIHDHNHHFIIYCDDLLFDEGQSEYRMLKGVMEGTLETPPSNVLVYATSNRQQLMPGQMADNLNISHVNGAERSAETIDECLSLADHFGLSLSFEPMTGEAYLTIVDNLFKRVKVDQEQLHEEAMRFAMQRGGPSGRTARHFLNHYQIYL